MTGDSDDAGVRKGGTQLPGGGEPVHLLHFDIHQHAVGTSGAVEREDADSVGALGDVLRYVTQHPFDQTPHFWIVIDNQ